MKNITLSPDDVKVIGRTNTQPISVPRTVRQIDLNGLTSMPAGKMVPIHAFAMLREDKLRSTMLQIRYDLMETAEIVENPIMVRTMAYFVPWLAFERFDGGMDEFNRSYNKVANANGGTVTPFFETMVAPAISANPIHRYLGMHSNAGDTINTSYIEAYNAIWNFRAANRSKTLYDANKRLKSNLTLAPAFWIHEQFKHLVPDFDQAAVDGAVSLSLVNTSLPVKGIGLYGTAQDVASGTLRETGGTTQALPAASTGASTGVGGIGIKYTGTGAAAVPAIYAQLQGAGIQVSLAGIELAKKTQAFAELKKQYGGLTDAHIIDMMMDGLTVPDQAWRQPILIADKTETFGTNKRFASDGPNLTDAVVNAGALTELHLAMPTMPTGGIVMVVAEIVPEQLFERQRDPLLYTTDVAQLPQFLRDELDPEKVDIIKNGEIDTSHSNPNGTFAYGPLNWKWGHSFTKIGGKYARPTVDESFNEDRQRIWAIEVANPVLGTDFYICSTFHTKPFVVTNADVGEVRTMGTAIIEGNTVFGARLVENDNDYTEVLAKAPTTKIAK